MDSAAGLPVVRFARRPGRRVACYRRGHSEHGRLQCTPAPAGWSQAGSTGRASAGGGEGKGAAGDTCAQVGELVVPVGADLGGWYGLDQSVHQVTGLGLMSLTSASAWP
jgi:hypothetical protein